MNSRLVAVFRACRVIASLVGVGTICSCANMHGGGVTIAMNEGAGRGDLLFLRPRLPNGQSLPFVMDTGATTSCIDKSLMPAPGLGKSCGSEDVWMFGRKVRADIYPAPILTLQDMRLTNLNSTIYVIDLAPISAARHQPVLGIMGMDYLAPYCLQLDFRSEKVRIMTNSVRNCRDLGVPIRMKDIGDGCVTINENLAGFSQIPSLLDTGCNYDGWLIPNVYEAWTNPAKNASLGISYATLHWERYPEVDLEGISSNQFSSGDPHLQFNGIGLAFLARHLATLDFPGKTLYLKRVQEGSPVLKFRQAQAEKASRSVMKILGHMKSGGRLPGWLKNDSWGNRREQLRFQFPDIMFCENVRKKGDPSLYQYEFRRLPDLNWQLEKAWRLDENNERFDLYPGYEPE